jgi:hypothetical protein
MLPPRERSRRVGDSKPWPAASQLPATPSKQWYGAETWLSPSWEVKASNPGPGGFVVRPHAANIPSSARKGGLLISQVFPGEEEGGVDEMGKETK